LQVPRVARYDLDEGGVFLMRAEAQAMVKEIEESLELLRRRL